MQQLYDEFLAYGDAIGPDHVAVWFWSKKPGPGTKGTLDRRRNARFCSQLKLAPSHSPYLIFTARYPGEALANDPKSFPAPADLGNHSVLSLNGTSAADTTRILSALADKLVTGKLADVSLDSREYWDRLQKAYEAVRDEITGLLGVTVSFDTGFVKAEVKIAK